ncbi:uncharacterized protein LOC121009202 [Bufo bufo]|uniref:uncharacterized protein LOC121009202 n=1 Tax=Bufo bufo TaxID=8384 RepID=UPI001ABE6705|nr:uncharacterized protein LOC121009202 [Bufo bufo]
MEVQAGIHLPSNFHDTEGIDEDQTRPDLGGCHHAILAKEVLVHPAHEDESGQLLETSPNTGPCVSGHRSLSRSEETQSDGLEIDRSLLEARGLSVEVLRTISHSRAESTSKKYSRIYRIFLQWCNNREVVASDPPLSAILQFLQDGLDKGLSPSTIRAHVSALSACLGRPMSQDPLIKRFLKGAERLKPRVLRPIPQWDLSVVLKGLCVPPFEPLNEVDLRFLSLKITFLLAITSAKRVGELQALGASEPYLKILQDKVLLRFLPTFLPKVPTFSNINQTICLPTFSPAATSPEEERLRTLDISRGLRIYLDRTSDFRRSENLLLTYTGKNRGLKASKPTLSRWIKEAIRLAFLSQDLTPPSFVSAHSTRAVSTSYAEKKLIPLDQICAAASWSSLNTFISHYRLESRQTEGMAFGQSVLSAALS